MREIKALILLDEPGGTHYATLVEQQIKLLETRMCLFKYTGDLLICCSNGSMTRNKGKALCVVHFGHGRLMTTDDERIACIEWKEGRYCYPLTNHRKLSRKFEFKRHKIRGTFQSFFDVQIPDDVKIIDP